MSERDVVLACIKFLMGMQLIGLEVQLQLNEDEQTRRVFNEGKKLFNLLCLATSDKETDD